MLFGFLKSREEKFLDAAYHGKIAKVKQFLKKGIDIQYTNSQGMNALKCAVSQNHIEIVSLLLEEGIDVNKYTVLSHTPLTKAISKGNVEIVKLLIEYGADTKMKGGGGLTPQEFAKDNEEILKLLSN